MTKKIIWLILAFKLKKCFLSSKIELLDYFCDSLEFKVQKLNIKAISLLI